MKTKLFAIVFILIGIVAANPVLAEKEKRNVSKFSEVSLRVPGKLYIKQGSKQSVEIEAKSSTLEKIIAEVKDGKLSIKFRNQKRFFFQNFDAGEITIKITTPKIDGLAVSGSGDIIADDLIETTNMSLAISGSGDINLAELTAKNVSASISGSGDIAIKDGGIATDFTISISGSGDVRASGFEARDVSVRVSGSGNSKVYVTEDLKVKVAGSGDVYYRGNPNIDSSVAGSGSVKKIR